MDNAVTTLLPMKGEIGDLLGLRWGSEVEGVMDSFLLNPLREFLERPGKKLRGRMVEIGFQLATGSSETIAQEKNYPWVKKASDLLESLHSASLIIDDIQDNSEMRRGEPTVHRKHGMPLALNAGNWLYFWPLQNVDRWEVSAETKLNIYRVCHRGLLRAHFGQALDVGLNIFEVPQKKVKATCLASLELKSGALTAMALALGAVLGGASAELESVCDQFGHAFGIALQMFDDAGNTTIEGAKQFEDLLLKRPSWIVAMAAESLSAVEYVEFSDRVNCLPNSEPLKNWLAENPIIMGARQEAKKYLDGALNILDSDLLKDGIKGKQHLRELTEILVRAYV